MGQAECCFGKEEDVTVRKPRIAEGGREEGRGPPLVALVGSQKEKRGGQEGKFSHMHPGFHSQG